MNKVFLFSDYFSLQVLSYEIEYAFNFEINEIILLEENHKKYPLIWENYSIKITVLKTIEDCVLYSDIILVFKNNSVSNDTINCICEFSQNHNKKVYCLNVPDFRMDAILQNEVADNSLDVDVDIDFCNKVNIVLLNIGALSFSMPTEILLRKVLLEFGVSLNQIFLPDSKWILHQYQELGLLNKYHFDIFENNIIKKTNATIISLDLGYDLNNISKYSTYIKKVCADYIVIVADGNYAICSSEIRNYVKFCCDKKIDLMFFSPFCIVDKQYIINCTENYLLGENEYFFNDLNAITIIKNDMLNKLSFPHGIKLCK